MHQAAAELGRPELVAIVADPARPLPAGRRLAAPARDRLRQPGRRRSTPRSPPGPSSPSCWPCGLLVLSRPGPDPPGLLPLAPRDVGLRAARAAPGPARPRPAARPPPPTPGPASRATPTRSGPRHLDTARGVLDAAIEALDRRLGGALTRDQRHRNEPVRLIHPADRGGEHRSAADGREPRSNQPATGRFRDDFGPFIFRSATTLPEALIRSLVQALPIIEKSVSS